MPDNDYTNIGRKIRENRKKLGMTQQQLANRSGVSMQHISNMENGKTEFSLKAVSKIKRVFEESGLYDPDLDVDTTKQQWINDVYDIMSDCTLDERHFLMTMLQNMKDALRETGVAGPDLKNGLHNKS